MFACLFVPDFPVQAIVRIETKDVRQTLKQSPIAVLDGHSSLLKVMAVNDAARSAGIKIGMTKLQAQICGEVWLIQRCAEPEASAQVALIECANTFSPRVESTQPGTVILDLTGTDRLFGSLEQTAQKIAAYTRECGFDLHIAIASNPDTAWCAARGFSGTTVIPRGEEAKRLKCLSARMLLAPPEILDTLDSWGIRTFGSLAELPSISLIERLGQDGLHLQNLARGQVNRALVSVEPETEFVETYEFDDPVENLESLAFVLNPMLQKLCSRLTFHSLATNELRLTLHLEVRQLQSGQKGEQYRHEWKLPVPTQSRNVLLTLIRLDLERNTFTAPIKKLTIEAVPVRPRKAQTNLFAPPSPEAENLEITLARIRGVVGNTDAEGISCVGSPKVLDTHKPDAFTVKTFAANKDISNPCAVSPTAAMRFFRPALETLVELDADKKPHLVQLWKKYRRVLAASGPWCTSGNWWNSATAWAREEWDVALKTYEGIGYYRIYCDWLSKKWFIEGIFD